MDISFIKDEIVLITKLKDQSNKRTHLLSEVNKQCIL